MVAKSNVMHLKYLLVHSKGTTRMALSLKFKITSGLLQSTFSDENYDMMSIPCLELSQFLGGEFYNNNTATIQNKKDQCLHVPCLYLATICFSVAAFDLGTIKAHWIIILMPAVIPTLIVIVYIAHHLIHKCLKEGKQCLSQQINIRS